MPTLSKSKTRPAAKGPKGGAIVSRQRELAAEENELQAKIDQLQRAIAEAPSLAAEQARRDRETLLTGSRGYYLQSVVPDARYNAQANAAARRERPPMLRAERTAARQQTLALVVVLAIALVWMLSRFI